MAKVTNIGLPKNEVKTEGQSLGLSNCPNLTAKINFRQYANGEAVVRIVNDRSLNLTSPPPRRVGELIQKGLGMKAKRTIKRMARQFQYLVENDKDYCGYCAFITLSYPYHFPIDHKIAKQHLDNFFKRIRRRIPKIMYMWVAELQKRGAIHFHILTPSYVDKALINEAWSGIISKWYEREGVVFDKVLPNVKKAFNAGAYMSKYMTKEDEKIQGNMYGISQIARKLLQPIIEDNISTGEYEAISIVQSALKECNSIEYHKVQSIEDKTVAIWFHDSQNILEILYNQNKRHGE
jgi:hypothetical protein